MISKAKNIIIKTQKESILKNPNSSKNNIKKKVTFSNFPENNKQQNNYSFDNTREKGNIINKEEMSLQPKNGHKESSKNTNKLEKENLNNKTQNNKEKKLVYNINNKESLITEQKIKNLLKEEKDIEKNKEEENTLTENVPKKKVIIIHPREFYLKEKTNNIKPKINHNLLSNINKELFSQINSIKKEFSDNDIHITETPKNLKKYLFKSKSRENIVSFSSSPKELFPYSKMYNNNEFFIKKQYKIIRSLKKEQNLLKIKLMKICENEKLLENEVLLNDSKNKIKIDLNIKRQQIKSMKSQKEEIIEKIHLLDIKINNKIANDLSLKFQKNEVLKNYIHNFNRDKEIAEIKSKKLIKESKLRKQKMNNEINLLKEKKLQEKILKEKEEEKQKQEKLLKFKEHQRTIELKQLKENEKKMLKSKPYIREKPLKNINSYLFKIKENQFLKSQKDLQRKENIKRKEYMRSVDFKELQEFSDNFDGKKEKIEEKNIFKKINLLKEWKERKNLLESYRSQSIETLENDNEKTDIINNLKEKKDNFMKLKMDYSKLIKEKFSPRIDKDLYNERINLIKKLEMPKNEKYKKNSYYFYHKKKRMKLKKVDPSKFKWKLKLEKDSLEKMNNSDMDMKYFIRRPKKINTSSIYSQRKTALIKDSIDSKQDNGLKKNKNENKEMVIRITDENKNKIRKIVPINKKFSYNNILEEKKLLEILNKKAVEGEKKLKENGGIENNIELGNQITSFLIDSISTKLRILEKIKNE